MDELVLDAIADHIATRLRPVQMPFPVTHDKTRNPHLWIPGHSRSKGPMCPLCAAERVQDERAYRYHVDHPLVRH